MEGQAVVEDAQELSSPGRVDIRCREVRPCRVCQLIDPCKLGCHIQWRRKTRCDIECKQLGTHIGLAQVEFKSLDGAHHRSGRVSRPPPRLRRAMRLASCSRIRRITAMDVA